LLREHRADLDALMAKPVKARWSVVVEMDHVIGRGFVVGDERLRTATSARASFERVDGGIVLVTIYPKVA
jgi:hypothetical protein